MPNIETVTVERDDVDVEILVNNENAIDRVLNNEDNWKGMFYPHLKTRQDVLDHFAYNFVENGVTQVNKLDGWADMEDDAVIMRRAR